MAAALDMKGIKVNVLLTKVERAPDHTAHVATFTVT